MSHFSVLVVVKPGGTAQELEQALAEILAPYDENRNMPPRLEPLDQATLIEMAKHYQVEATPTALLPFIEDWSGEGKLHDGALCRITRYNPDSKWDWYQVGGRFNHRISDNRVPARDCTYTPFAMVDRYGFWHEKGKMGWWDVVTDEKDQVAWKAQVKKLLEDAGDFDVVLVDCHI